ncbi:MAG: multi-sensor signal transduction histidine kinase [Bacteriovoracaceae bacterium]|nr:multi-sensor signal transduction histidine kinase [Bacteriovoracaceae bacterium]
MDAQDRDRMITVGELSSILAHEIKNPMNSIIINMEVLKNSILELTQGSQSTAAERAKKYVEVIEVEIRRLDKVIKGFLDFAHPSTSTKIKFKLNPLIQEIRDFIQNEMAHKTIDLQLDLAKVSPAILGSPDQIKQALLNLLLNSMQSLPNGGTILIQSIDDHKNAKIIVRDSGVGIEKELLSKIFTPYFTTKAKGSGLGLSIVQRVVQEHNGNVEVKSELGKGTEFTLIFPLVANGGT